MVVPAKFEVRQLSSCPVNTSDLPGLYRARLGFTHVREDRNEEHPAFGR